MEYVKPCRDMQSHRVFKDITDWKLSIKKLEKSEKKSRSFRQNFYCSIFQLDENFFSEPLHGFVEEITVHSGTESIYRIKWREIIHPDDLFLKSEFYSGTIYDATEGKETEKYLANIETARKREIHRIKNNLQVISSLLHLQAEKFSNRECIKDSEILAAFRERQDRIIPLAHIHEKLHKGNELNRFDFFSYIEELTDNLFLTYRLESTYANLNVDLEKHIFFDMNAAVPSGMNVNELISNSLKDAFFSHISRDILFGQNL